MEYIVTVKIYKDWEMLQYIQLVVKTMSIDGDKFMRTLDNKIILPDGATHYEIQGIYKL